MRILSAPQKGHVLMKVGIYCDRLDANIASCWYRGLYPGAWLENNGHVMRLFDYIPGASTVRALDVIILVKPLTYKAYNLALIAHTQGTPIVLDLCDDIFLPAYGAGKGTEAAYFKAMSKLAASIVTTGPAMAAVLAREIGPDKHIWIISDPVETAVDNALTISALKRWKRQSWVRRKSAKALERLTDRWRLIKHRSRKFLFRMGQRIRHGSPRCMRGVEQLFEFIKTGKRPVSPNSGAESTAAPADIRSSIPEANSLRSRAGGDT